MFTIEKEKLLLSSVDLAPEVLPSIEDLIVSLQDAENRMRIIVEKLFFRFTTV